MCPEPAPPQVDPTSAPEPSPPSTAGQPAIPTTGTPGLPDQPNVPASPQSPVAPAPSGPPVERPISNRVITASVIFHTVVALILLAGIILDFWNTGTPEKRYAMQTLMAFSLSFVFYAWHPFGNVAKGQLPGLGQLAIELAGPVVVFIAVFVVTDVFAPKDRTSIYQFAYGHAPPTCDVLDVSLAPGHGDVAELVNDNNEVMGVRVLLAESQSKGELHMKWTIGNEVLTFSSPVVPGEKKILENVTFK